MGLQKSSSRDGRDGKGRSGKWLMGQTDCETLFVREKKGLDIPLRDPKDIFLAAFFGGLQKTQYDNRN